MINPYKIKVAGFPRRTTIAGSLYGEIMQDGADEIIKQLGITKNSTVLDVGACSFKLACYIAEKTKANVTGIEQVPERVEFAKKHYGYAETLNIVEGIFPQDFKEEVDVYILHICALVRDSQKEVIDAIPKGKMVIGNGLSLLHHIRNNKLESKQISLGVTYGSASFYIFKNL